MGKRSVRIVIDFKDPSESNAHSHYQEKRAQGHQSTRQQTYQQSSSHSSWYQQFVKVFNDIGNSIDRRFPGNGFAILCGLVGFLLAQFFLELHVLQVLIAAVLIVGGISLGQKYDGNPRILNTVRRWTKNLPWF